MTPRTYKIGIERVLVRFRRRWPTKYMDTTVIRDRANQRRNHAFIRKLGTTGEVHG